MKYILLVLLLFHQTSYANNNLEISIITCAPGKEVYAVFGHSAIRVVDKENRTDKIYDFGTFDFNTPNFTYKFLKGKLKYHLSVRNTNQFIRAYTYENRKVVEQQLNLTELEKQQIIDKLNFLYEPENRYYFYSFITKNCSTDLRDLLTLVGVEFSDELLKESKRDLLNTYLQETPWLRLGVNIILGQQLDEKATRFQSMFLGFQKQISLILFLLIGTSGVLITVLWIFSGHEEVTNNLNVLWCNPLYLLAIPLFWKNKFNKILIIVLTVSLVLALIIWVLGIQCFDRSIIPLLIILGLINYNEIKKLTTLST